MDKTNINERLEEIRNKLWELRSEIVGLVAEVSAINRKVGWTNAKESDRKFVELTDNTSPKSEDTVIAFEKNISRMIAAENRGFEIDRLNNDIYSAIDKINNSIYEIKTAIK